MSERAWWNRPVCPSTDWITPRERWARRRAAARRALAALYGTPALVVYAVAGALALVSAVLAAGLGLAHPETPWLGGIAVVAVSAGVLLHRARAGRGRLAGLPAAAPPVLALTLAVALVGVPWLLAGSTSHGPVRPLASGLPWAIDGATQIGDTVALAATDGDDGTVTMLDLRTGAVTTTHVGSTVRWLSAAGDDVVVTTGDALVLLGADGSELWRVPTHGVEGPVPVAADGDVVVIADSSAADPGGDGSAVALRRDGSEVWHADGTSAFRDLAAGGVFEYGAQLPPVAVLTAHGSSTVVDPQTGRVLHESALAPVAAAGDLVLWQDRAHDGTCSASATRGDDEVWRTSLPCLTFAWSARGTTLRYAHRVDTASPWALLALDLTTGTATPLDEATVDDEDGIALEAVSGLDVPMAGRLIGRDAASGAVRWTQPAAPWHVGGLWVQSGHGTVVVATQPITANPLASLRTRDQVTVLDLRTGAVAAWQRCRTGATVAVPLDRDRALALCHEPGGTVQAWLVG